MTNRDALVKARANLRVDGVGDGLGRVVRFDADGDTWSEVICMAAAPLILSALLDDAYRRAYAEEPVEVTVELQLPGRIQSIEIEGTVRI